MSVHPDLETLSALLDGEAEDPTGHLRSCDRCRAALAVLEKVRSRMADVPATPPGLRERSIQAALAAARRDPVAAPAPPQRTSRFTRWVAAGSIAALFVVLAGTVASLSRSDDRRSSTTAAFESRTSAAESSGRAAGDARPGVSPPPAESSDDMGDVVAPPLLAARLAAQLGVPAGAHHRAAQSAASDSAGAAPRASSPVPPPSSQAHRALERAHCVAEGQATLADAQPVYLATGTYLGRPVVVVAYSVAGRIMASVLYREGCRLAFSVAVT